MEVTRALIHSVRVRKDKTLVCGVDVDDKHDLNKSMVEQAMLRGIIEDTYRRHIGGASEVPAFDSTARIETPVK
ncbi:unnamed protein product, partial [Symbiodinium pilosum]